MIQIWAKISDFIITLSSVCEECALGNPKIKVWAKNGFIFFGK